MTAVILSLMGVFMGLMIHDKPFSVMMGGIGAISLAGIVVNNSIVLMDFTLQLRKRGYAMAEAAVLAGAVRLRPVMLTAVTTVLGLLPVAIGMEVDFIGWPSVEFGSEGGTFWIPMALAVIYGLSVATLLTLIVVPVLYTTTERMKQSLARLLFARRGEPAAESEPEAGSSPAVTGAAGS
jgi:multidrug efflux pump subunit AcrB